MAYMRGDYYRGDYYRGDPGIFSTLFRTVGGAIKGFVTGGPTGAVLGAAAGLVGKSSSGQNPSNLPVLAPTFAPAPAGINVMPPVPVETDNVPTMPAAGGAIPTFALPAFPGRRQHLNRSTYVTRGGGTSHWPHALTVHQRGTTLVTARRMNVGNARALRRALRRAAGFAKLAKRTRRAASMLASAVGVRHRGKKIRGR